MINLKMVALWLKCSFVGVVFLALALFIEGIERTIYVEVQEVSILRHSKYEKDLIQIKFKNLESGEEIQENFYCDQGKCQRLKRGGKYSFAYDFAMAYYGTQYFLRKIHELQ